MADLVREGASKIEGMEVKMLSCDEAKPSDVLWADGLAVGTPTNLGGISWKMKKFWDEFAADHWDKVDGRICCTFSSQGGHAGGAELACQAMGTVLMNFGFLFFGVTDYVSKIHTLHYGACVTKQPRDEISKAACIRLGVRLAEWTAVFFDGKKHLHPLLTTKKADKDRAAAEKEKKEEDVKKSTSVRLVVTIDVPPENQAEWISKAKELSEETWKEDGCLFYKFLKGKASKSRFLVVEDWASRKHLERHSASAHFQKIVPAQGAISTNVEIAVGQSPLGVNQKRKAPQDANVANVVHVLTTMDVAEPTQYEWTRLAKDLVRTARKVDGCIDYAYFLKDEQDEKNAGYVRYVCVEEWSNVQAREEFHKTSQYTQFSPLLLKLCKQVRQDVCTAIEGYPIRTTSPTMSLAPTSSKKVLVFTKATDYIHASLPAAASFIARLCTKLGYEPIVSDDGALLEKGCGINFEAVCMVNNSGQLFDPSKECLNDHIRAGRGVFGLHACLASFLNGQDAFGGTKMKATTHIIEETFGAHFLNHPPPQDGDVHIDTKAAKALNLELPANFTHHDEFFNYNKNPADVEGVTVVATVDESTYEGGLMGKRHPVVWYRALGEAKAPIFYSALGHFSHFYNGLGKPHVAQIIEAGLRHVLKINDSS
eukprot:CAMPEP_0184480190 /NCGR_PEP_ID=MMETSP0113_2-20130426/1671_1 /TAXON_ID=91329 /ORGANISM="Norrisiella sphaerica, Strain BC52" /LENGTH=652 /DNA_ID=CAMNT_0026858501 /DNA_START=107 /DNA_END=2065 /DNA_ORIENTATION=-